ncbi:methionine biosynthesis protein MetW [Chitinimonas sp.]|uniref:methionine biosynthesis protein MetW n=1 Tax=Chitinimonas sp. TaxID=1934313 RepID=UPI0035B07A8A
MRPFWVAVAVQVAAFGAASLLVEGGVLGEAGWLPLQICMALGLSVCARQPRWWWLIHAMFFPLVIVARWLDLPPWLYLALFVLAYAVFGRLDRSRVPLYLSGTPALEALQQLIPDGARVLDLGAGTGTVVSFLTHHRQLRVEGVEHAWLPWLLARLRCAWLGRGTVIRADLLNWPLAGYDVVYAFLSPAIMPALWQKAKSEMRPGSVLVSNSFDIPGVAADAVIDCAAGRGGRLYVWRMP